MQNSYSNENYAGFWVRLAAYVIDSVIVAIGLLVVRLAWIGIGALISGTILDENVLFHYSLKDIVLYIFKVMYFALLTWCTGTTIGKRLMNLRVVSADRNEKLSFVDVLYRETVGRFLCGISIWIGYIIVGIDKEKRGFHDMLCDTRVVYEKKVKMYSEYQRHQYSHRHQNHYRQRHFLGQFNKKRRNTCRCGNRIMYRKMCRCSVSHSQDNRIELCQMEDIVS